MPNRIIKDSINESESLSECTVFATDLYKRLITYADDYGRFNSDTAIIRARLYPREYETVGEGDIINALVELAGVGKIEFYTPEVFGQKGKKGVYGVFPNWKDHQRIRDSKAKTPEPYDTSINDWYLRRFVSLDMKAEIIERDGFKCRICGKFLTSCRDSRRFAKLGHGLYHIDHIVPCQQGGRSTLENLRLTCPECNLRRKKKFSFKEILEETLSDENTFSQQSAANCRNSPPESNPNPYPNTKIMRPAITPTAIPRAISMGYIRMSFCLMPILRSFRTSSRMTSQNALIDCLSTWNPPGRSTRIILQRSGTGQSGTIRRRL